MLEAELQAQILALYLNDKKSIRQISTIVGVDRKTVRRVIDRKKSSARKTPWEPNKFA